MIKRLFKDESGGSALEYVLYAALIGVVISAAFSLFVNDGIQLIFNALVGGLATV
ncbi:MAG: Flp family type IVb pilin [Pseudomonadota bacterium]